MTVAIVLKANTYRPLLEHWGVSVCINNVENDGRSGGQRRCSVVNCLHNDMILLCFLKCGRYGIQMCLQWTVQGAQSV